MVPTRITTARLRLETISVDDAPSMFEEFAGDPDATRYISRRRHLDVKETIAFAADRAAEWDEGRSWMWSVKLKPATDRTIGRCALKSEGRLSIGYILATRIQGQGMAGEIIAALLPVAAGLATQLFAEVDPENAPSVRILERAGFILERRLPKHLVLPNLGPTPRDCLLFARDLTGIRNIS